MNRKRISIFILSLFMVLCVSVSFFAGTHTAYACYCDPNLAVFPNGHDPNCVNHVYVGSDTTFCGGNSTTVTGGNSTTNTSGSISCSPSSVKDFKTLIMNLFIGCLLTPMVYILIGLALVIFLWGVIRFVRSESEEEKASGKEFIMWGIIGLFVIISMWALVGIVQNTVRLNNTSEFNIPK